MPTNASVVFLLASPARLCWAPTKRSKRSYRSSGACNRWALFWMGVCNAVKPPRFATSWRAIARTWSGCGMNWLPCRVLPSAAGHGWRRGKSICRRPRPGVLPPAPLHDDTARAALDCFLPVGAIVRAVHLTNDIGRAALLFSSTCWLRPDNHIHLEFTFRRLPDVLC